MKPIALTTTILAISGFLVATSAHSFNANNSSGHASYSRGMAGTCPVGTCSKKGTAQAQNLKFCSAANCAKGKATK